ncbi:hypothetical protein FPQ18DRAFT_394593 [Pyronema domesticum]|uniref:Uncharacterized protein n=1 Tax=Pyronema omphalodes (strain CBS 100304) TaxID=1076935 RepID=U4LJL6_PYROM|nr:hypothetical protein FPQ18DRAFT_394593 [Pyronema domesticum]CCX12676.1 Protein of unknown function [Pyronema omphalodes CBS 100304]
MSHTQQQYWSSHSQPAGYDNQYNAPLGTQHTHQSSAQYHDRRTQNPGAPLRDAVHQSSAHFAHHPPGYGSVALPLYPTRRDDYVYPPTPRPENTETVPTQFYQKPSRINSDTTNPPHPPNSPGYQEYQNGYATEGYAGNITSAGARYSEKGPATIGIERTESDVGGLGSGSVLSNGDSRLETASIVMHSISMQPTLNIISPGRQDDLATREAITEKVSQLPALLVLLIVLAMMGAIATGQALGDQYFDYSYGGIGCVVLVGCWFWYFIWVCIRCKTPWFDDTSKLESREETRAKEIQQKRNNRAMKKAKQSESQTDMQVVKL